MPIEKKQLRMDFVIEESEIIDKERRIIRFKMVPDPSRYERRKINGEDGYYDKYENVFFSDKAMSNAARTLAGVPIYAPSPSVGDLKEYLTEAMNRIAKSLQSEVEWKPQVDRASTYLQVNIRRRLGFVVLYVDIVKSTQLSRLLSDVAYRTLVSTFLQEMTLLVDIHGGYVHKYTGDGLIAFFPAEQSYMGPTDSAVDCAVIMRILMQQVLNPLLEGKSYPPLEFRIGIDSGETQIVQLGADRVKQTIDLLGYTMNIAAKMCAVCPSSGILIGESVYTNLHITRKRHFQRENLPLEKWNYLDAATNSLYALYGLTS